LTLFILVDCIGFEGNFRFGLNHLLIYQSIIWINFVCSSHNWYVAWLQSFQLLSSLQIKEKITFNFDLYIYSTSFQLLSILHFLKKLTCTLYLYSDDYLHVLLTFIRWLLSLFWLHTLYVSFLFSFLPLPLLERAINNNDITWLLIFIWLCW